MLNGARRLEVLFSHPKTCTLHRRGTRLAVRRRSHVCNSMTKLGAEPTQSNSRRLGRLHEQARSQRRPCHRLVASPTGSLLLRLVGHRARLSRSLGKGIIAAVRTARSAQPKCWKCWITLHGEKASGEVSHRNDAANDKQEDVCWQG